MDKQLTKIEAQNEFVKLKRQFFRQQITEKEFISRKEKLLKLL